jgi:hypothetical protein
MEKKFTDGIVPKYYVQVFQKRTSVLRKQQFYWRLLASNRSILLTSEKYHNFSDVFEVAKSLSVSLGGDGVAPLEDYTDRGLANDMNRNYKRIIF